MNVGQRREPLVTTGGAVYEAWERFVQGDDRVLGVRPEVAISWHRCREQYRVDPHRRQAPIAVTEIEHTPEHDGVFAELGFRAGSVSQDVGFAGGVVTVTDSTGRILAAWVIRPRWAGPPMRTWPRGGRSRRSVRTARCGYRPFRDARGRPPRVWTGSVAS